MSDDSLRDKLKMLNDKINSKENKTDKAVFNIAKTDDEMHIAFGIAVMSTDDDGNLVEDRQRDMIEPIELEKMAYRYTIYHGDVGQYHETSGEGRVAESFVLTPEKLLAMGIPSDSKKVLWWVGLYIENDAAWQRVKSGEFGAFSIEGIAMRTEV